MEFVSYGVATGMILCLISGGFIGKIEASGRSDQVFPRYEFVGSHDGCELVRTIKSPEQQETSLVCER